MCKLEGVGVGDNLMCLVQCQCGSKADILLAHHLSSNVKFIFFIDNLLFIWYW